MSGKISVILETDTSGIIREYQVEKVVVERKMRVDGVLVLHKKPVTTARLTPLTWPILRVTLPSCTDLGA
jgi:hypothetical protein